MGKLTRKQYRAMPTLSQARLAGCPLCGKPTTPFSEVLFDGMVWHDSRIVDAGLVDPETGVIYDEYL